MNHSAGGREKAESLRIVVKHKISSIIGKIQMSIT